jgi:hypothetical protein
LFAGAKHVKAELGLTKFAGEGWYSRGGDTLLFVVEFGPEGIGYRGYCWNGRTRDDILRSVGLTTILPIRYE